MRLLRIRCGNEWRQRMADSPVPVHQIREHTGSSPGKGLKPYTIYAKCGATIDSRKPDTGVRMTAWTSEVTCESCR